MIQYTYCISVYLLVLLLFEVEVLIGTTDHMKRKLVVLQKYNSSLQHAVGSLFLSSLMELFIMALLEVVHVQLCFYHIQLYITMFQVLGPLELRWTVHYVKWMELFWV